MGVMLALSAVFAVVITAISIPSDNARAQVADATTAVEARAAAWWDGLTPAERTNALFGKEHDEIEDGTGTPANEGRDLPASADSAYADLVAAGTAPTGTPPTGAIIGKDNVNALVDGNTTTTGDIYAVGEQETTSAGDANAAITGVQALRGFQSVEIWWNQLTCVEARTAVGEDNGDLVVEGAAGSEVVEASDVCDGTMAAGQTVDAVVDSTSTKAYADVKPMVDAVGQAILGLDAAGSSSSADNTRAMQWWDSLTAVQRAVALYGNQISSITDPADDATDATLANVTRDWIASQDYGDLNANLMAMVPADTEPSSLNAASKALVPQVKALINDRWQWVYAMGGSNTMGTSELVYWWDSIGSAQRRTAVGLDNEAQAADPASFNAAGYSVDWDDLNPATGLTAAGKALEEQVFKVGQAILFINPEPLPNVAEWWNTLNAQQMVNVVYGDPLAMEDDPASTTTPRAQRTVAHENDRAAFQNMYAGLSGGVIYSDLPTATTALLTRHGTASAPGVDVNGDETIDTTAVDHDGDDTTADVAENELISTKLIVDALAAEIFDPPAPASTPYGGFAADGTGSADTIVVDDNDFDWPYNAMNKAANVGDWWETTDCRVMRIAVGEDNDYLDPGNAGPDDTADTDDDVAAQPSIYCRHFPGHDNNPDNDLSEDAQKRVTEVGAALLNLAVTENMTHAVRPSFNMPPERKNAALHEVTIDGVAQVGRELEANTTNLNDVDGLGTFSYQWLRNGSPISGAVGVKYTLQAADANATLSVTVSYVDGERYPEMVTSGTTSTITGSPGEISKIEPGIRGVTVSAGEKVVLSVRAYGLQGVQDQDLSPGMGLEWNAKDGGSVETAEDGNWQVVHTARSSPGTYTVVASFKNDGDCVAKLEDRDTACTAEFVVRVRRAAPPQPVEEAPVNPPGEIPSLLSDDGGNQYEVFTPVEGGTFDSGEGYSITAPSGAVPNGEFIGVRMSDDGPASNVGMTHQRYTLGGNMYGVHAVDSSEATVSSYVLDDPANVCVPLPDELRTNISDLALVVINSDGSLTILAANVHIGAAGTSVCGNLSNLPASVAVGSQGAPAAIPTATPEPEPVLPDTGATAPSSNSALWALILGIAIVSLGTLTALSRRRNRSVSR